MANLEKAIQDIQKEIRIDEETGIGYISLRGAARVVDVDPVTIRGLFKTSRSLGSERESKFFTNLTRAGFQGGAKELEEITDLVLGCIIEYYAFEARTYRGQEQAFLAARAFMVIGIRQWMREVTGYETHLEVTCPYGHVLAGSWKDEREAGKPVRKSFTAFLAEIEDYQYAKRTEQCYSVLFGCSSDGLRAIKAGEKACKVAKDALPDAIEIKAIAELEKAVVENYIPGMELSKMIAYFGAIIKAQYHLPHFGRDKSRAYVWKELCGLDRETAQLNPGKTKILKSQSVMKTLKPSESDFNF